VCEWGMSDKLGPIHYSGKDEHVFLGRDFGKPKEHSETIQVEIDREVKRIIDEQHAVAHKILSENLETLHKLARAVLVKETLDADDIEKIVRGEPFFTGPSGSRESDKAVGSGFGKLGAA